MCVMIEVPREKAVEIAKDVRRLSHEALVPLYISARYMVESGMTPGEMVAYLEKNYMCKEEE